MYYFISIDIIFGKQIEMDIKYKKKSQLKFDKEEITHHLSEYWKKGSIVLYLNDALIKGDKRYV